MCQTAALKADNIPTTTPTPAVLPRQAIQTPHAIAPPASPLPTVVFLPTDTPPPITPPTPPPGVEIVGYSVEGRAITAQRFGLGARALLLVGGIHGGWEANTVTLMQQLIDHFSAAPQAIPAGVALVIVPVANPDGLQYGHIPFGRFNADGVDLNRNWSCGWSHDAFWRDERVNPGLYAFSEPETIALSAYILRLRPAAALFYHSAANGIFAGNCGGDHGSAALARVLGGATGYSFAGAFNSYPVSGAESDWADGQGIPAADVELQTSTDSEYTRNLRGVTALLAWLAVQP